MNPRTRLTILLTSVLFLFALAPAMAFDFTELIDAVHETTLDNGLKVIVMERPDAPVVSCVTYANVGGVDDPKEYTGLAHMLEHMAFKGTTTIGTTDYEAEKVAMAKEDSLWYLVRSERKKGRFADSTKLAELEAAFEASIEEARSYVIANDWDGRLEKQGAVGINAGTAKDQTQYYMSLPENKLELWMAQESERFVHPVFREMYRERMVIAEERRQTLENNPIMRTIAAMQAAAFVAHPYHTPVVGHMSDIMNFSRDAVKDYFHKYYVPSNMIISIVGDVKYKDVFKMAEKYFGRIAPAPQPERVATVEPEQVGERRVTLWDPAQPIFVCGFHIPEDTHPDWPAIEALNDYLAQGRTSLLYTSLVKEKKLASFVGMFLGWPGNKYPCLAMIYGAPNQDVTNDQIEEEVFAQVARLRDELIPPEELDKIKARARANFIGGLGTNNGFATALAGFQNDWGDWRELFNELDRINAVTAEDIQRVAQKYFVRKNCTIAHLNTEEAES